MVCAQVVDIEIETPDNGGAAQFGAFVPLDHAPHTTLEHFFFCNYCKDMEAPVVLLPSRLLSIINCAPGRSGVVAPCFFGVIALFGLHESSGSRQHHVQLSLAVMRFEAPLWEII